MFAVFEISGILNYCCVDILSCYVCPLHRLDILVTQFPFVSIYYFFHVTLQNHSVSIINDSIKLPLTSRPVVFISPVALSVSIELSILWSMCLLLVKILCAVSTKGKYQYQNSHDICKIINTGLKYPIKPIFALYVKQRVTRFLRLTVSPLACMH